MRKRGTKGRKAIASLCVPHKRSTPAFQVIGCITHCTCAILCKAICFVQCIFLGMAYPPPPPSPRRPLATFTFGEAALQTKEPPPGGGEGGRTTFQTQTKNRGCSTHEYEAQHGATWYGPDTTLVRRGATWCDLARSGYDHDMAW